MTILRCSSRATCIHHSRSPFCICRPGPLCHSQTHSSLYQLASSCAAPTRLYPKHNCLRLCDASCFRSESNAGLAGRSDGPGFGSLAAHVDWPFCTMTMSTPRMPSKWHVTERSTPLISTVYVPSVHEPCTTQWRVHEVGAPSICRGVMTRNQNHLKVSSTRHGRPPCDLRGQSLRRPRRRGCISWLSDQLEGPGASRAAPRSMNAIAPTKFPT